VIQCHSDRVLQKSEVNVSTGYYKKVKQCVSTDPVRPPLYRTLVSTSQVRLMGRGNIEWHVSTTRTAMPVHRVLRVLQKSEGNGNMVLWTIEDRKVKGMEWQ
jgi:hypothetical protein